MGGYPGFQVDFPPTPKALSHFPSVHPLDRFGLSATASVPRFQGLNRVREVDSRGA